MTPEQTIIAIYAKSGLAQTRGYGAATARGWRDARETEAFMDGCRWLLGEIAKNFEIAPKTPANEDR